MDLGTAIVASVSVICVFGSVTAIILKSMDENKK